MAHVAEREALAVNAVGSSPCLEAHKSAAFVHDVASVIRAELMYQFFSPGVGVLDLACPVVQDHARLQEAAVCHVDKLPDELWAKIFTHLRLWDRVRAAMVCHRWRRASLGSPRWLWSVIPTSCGPEACRFYLERAQRVPVTFRVQLRRDTIKEYSDIIKEHLAHMRVLALSIRSSPDEQRWASGHMHRCLEAALQGPAPILEVFRVDNDHGWLHIDLGVLPSLNNYALRAIQLSGVDLSCAGGANVRSLVLAIPADPLHRLTEQYWPLLFSFPALEALALKITTPTTLPNLGGPFPTTLKRLTLKLGYASFQRLIDFERFARLDFLRVTFHDFSDDSPDLAAVLPLFRDFVPASASVKFNGWLLDMMVVDTAGRRRIVQRFICRDASWCVPLAQATRLTIGGLATLPYTQRDVLSSLRALEELTLDVITGNGGSEYIWHSGPRTACPSLRAVHLRSPRNTFRIELGVVSDIVQLAPGKLDTLVLDRVHVWGRPRDEVDASLHDLADTVSIVDSGTVWPECYSAWATSWEDMMR